MNRNTESHFSQLPQVDIQRSMFDRSASHKTSFNTGQLIPFFWDEVLPSDTFRVSTSVVARLQTLLTPIMDNVYLDTYYFFVPARLTWSHWKEFMGENSASAWLPSVEYSVPYVEYPTGGFNVGTIADYLGVPTGVESTNPDDCPMALPFRAYALICNEWFRDQNLTDPLNIPVGDSNQTGTNGSSYVNDVANGGIPFRVAKYHDYFTSCLPSPQKGPSVSATGIGVSGDLPVVAKKDRVDGALLTEGLYFKGVNANPTGAYQTRPIYGATDPSVTGYDGSIEAKYALNQTTSEATGNLEITPANLWAKGDTYLNVDIGVNDLRLAFQLQKFYEKNARAGTRYREVIREHFGATSPDARMMVPEYLGGHRFPLAIHQIANQAQSSGEYLGDVGAMSNTSDVHDDFIKSFTEHGYVIGVCCVRYDHSYPQGLEKAWSRRKLTDFYWPVFANVGEQPVRKREIYLADGSDTTADNGAVFGYQEVYAEYRYKPSRCSAEMRPGVSNSLASWHLADYYTSQPSLSDAWIREDAASIDRTLAVTSSAANQVFCDFYVKNIVTRAMPMYSIPGLIDHH